MFLSTPHSKMLCHFESILGREDTVFLIIFGTNELEQAKSVAVVSSQNRLLHLRPQTKLVHP